MKPGTYIRRLFRKRMLKVEKRMTRRERFWRAMSKIYARCHLATLATTYKQPFDHAHNVSRIVRRHEMLTALADRWGLLPPTLK